MKLNTASPFIAGVTRQAAQFRADPGVSDAENVDFSPVRGASSRARTAHVAKITTGTIDRTYAVASHLWEHRSGTRYGILCQGGSTPVIYNADTGASLTVSLKAGTPNYNYLGGVSGARDLKFLAAGDYLFVLNAGAEPSLASGAVAPKITGVTAGQSLGGAFITRANYEKTYTITVTLSTGVAITQTMTTFPAGGGAGVAPDTQAIATGFAAGFTAAAGMIAAGISCVSSGSVIQFIYTAAPTATSINAIRAADADGNNSIKALFNEVELVSDLPTTFRHGYRIKISGVGREDADDYTVRFVADDPTNAAFGPGHWEEACPYGTFTSLDPTTMPHAFVRNSTGTTFEYQQIAWTDRLTGDHQTNPFPSFIEGLNGAEPTYAAHRGIPITRLFYMQNRLGLLAGESVILSETDQPFNLMRTTVRSVPPSDPIDMRAPGSDSVIFHNAVVHNEVALLFASRGVHTIFSDGPLSPSTVQMTMAAAIETERDERCDAISNGRSVFAPGRRCDDYGSLYELIRAGDSPRFAHADVSAAVPDWFGHIRHMTTDAATGAIYCLDSDDKTRLAVHRFMWAGDQKASSSWTAYTFSADITGLQAMGSTLFLVFNHTDGFYLEKMQTQGDTLSLANAICVDRAVVYAGFTSVAYNSATGLTTFTFPYQIETGDTLAVVQADGSAYEIYQQSTGPGAAAYARVLGDKTGTTVFGGVAYDVTLTIKNPYQRTQEGYAALDPVAVLLSGVVQYYNSGPFTVRVTLQDGRKYESVVSPRLGSALSLVGDLSLMTGGTGFRVGAREDETIVSFEALGTSPICLTGVSWTHRKSSRGRGGNA